MQKTSITLSDTMLQYVMENTLRESPELRHLREETSHLECSIMQISPDQGQFIDLLIKILNPQKIIEIGTFTGYSALVMAQASADSTRIICCDIDEEWTKIAKKHWQNAGVAHKIELKLAPALDTLNTLLASNSATFDFAFIDANKTDYDHYYEACLSLLKPGGMIAIDNVFWGGSVANLNIGDEDTVAIRNLNKKLQSDERIDFSVLPIGDGLTLARKK